VQCRKPPLISSNKTEAGFSPTAFLVPMKPRTTSILHGLLVLSAATLVHPATRAAEQLLPPTAATGSAATQDTRYGLVNGLDHRSWYGQGNFPEPFLVDDSGLEEDETRLDWLHTKANSQQTDVASVEVEKGFGLLTLELKVPFERTASPGETSQGMGNIEVGGRHPFYQFVSATGFFDTTLGAAMEVGIPVNSAVSKNTELVPKIFNDLRVGENFTLQSLLGYSTLLGGGADGGLQAFEYGFVFGYSIEHRRLPLPGIQQLIPILEIKGETQLNHDDAGHNTVVGNAAVRANLNTLWGVQPRLGLGFVFPINSNARAEIHWGIFTSLVFEY
jgi:hypothetical protein